MIQRIVFNIAFFLLVLYAPWWLVLLAAMFGVYYFTSYYEVLGFGILYDILYGTIGSGIFGYGITGFVTSFILYLSIDRLKRELR